jgi:hypothetical protein
MLEVEVVDVAGFNALTERYSYATNGQTLDPLRTMY